MLLIIAIAPALQACISMHTFLQYIRMRHNSVQLTIFLAQFYTHSTASHEMQAECAFPIGPDSHEAKPQRRLLWTICGVDMGTSYTYWSRSAWIELPSCHRKVHALGKPRFESMKERLRGLDALYLNSKKRHGVNLSN